MTIYVGSRYEEDPIDRVPVGDQYIPTLYHQMAPWRQDFSYGLHVCEYGTRLDRLAADYFGDPELSWIIANANPEVFYPDEIPTGTVLRIPSARVVG